MIRLLNLLTGPGRDVARRVAVSVDDGRAADPPPGKQHAGSRLSPPAASRHARGIASPNVLLGGPVFLAGCLLASA